MAAPVLSMAGVSLIRDGVPLLSDIAWTVHRGEHWCVLGPNGSGKTTLLRLAAGYLQPTAGRVEVLGARFGEADVRALRRRIGWVSPTLAGYQHPHETAADVVLGGVYAAIGLFHEIPTDLERRRAADLLDVVGCGSLASRRFGVLSQGERQRVLMARALISDPDLLVLDEPAAALDLGAREDLLDSLEVLTSAPNGPTVILVTHHLEEITPGFSHALLLAGGRVLAAGPKEEVIQPAPVSTAMGVDLELIERDGRVWSIVRRYEG